MMTMPLKLTENWKNQCPLIRHSSRKVRPEYESYKLRIFFVWKVSGWNTNFFRFRAAHLAHMRTLLRINLCFTSFSRLCDVITIIENIKNVLIIVVSAAIVAAASVAAVAVYHTLFQSYSDMILMWYSFLFKKHCARSTKY